MKNPLRGSDIAEVINNDGVGWLQRHGPFQKRHGLVEPPQLEITPAERVHEKPVARVGFNRLADHLQGFGRVTVIDQQPVAKIVQHMGIIRVQIQRYPERGLGITAAIKIFEGNPAIEIQL